MLTDTAIRALKPRAKTHRVSDRQGLAIEVTPQGVRLWRFRYQWAGKERMISLGRYPEITLVAARTRALEWRRELAAGRDPAQVKRDLVAKQFDHELSKFPVIALEWLAERKEEFKPATYRKAHSIIHGDLMPGLKYANVATLTTPQAIVVLEKIAARAPHMAEKAKGYLSQIIDYSIKKGLREDGRTLSLRRAVRMPKAVSVPAATTRAELAHVLKAIDRYEGEVTQSALRFAALTTMRPMNVVQARWENLDLNDRTWTIPGEQMKNGNPHTVPLPTQAIELLQKAKLWKAHGGWVFPPLSKQTTPHLHRDTLSKALRSSGLRGKHVPHGFRSSFRTMAREEFDEREDVLEVQIAHAKKGVVNKAYDRALFLKKRVLIMQRWADLLDELRVAT